MNLGLGEKISVRVSERSMMPELLRNRLYRVHLESDNIEKMKNGNIRKMEYDEHQEDWK